jgi:EAL domain-containing protein (putative c-di-GMP-specific phosphodiesterase class I)
VRLSLDDFGTGYSSLGALHRFQVDRVKIDRSFVATAPGDRRAEAIIRAVIGLARDLGLQVVAEGVESTAQLDWLRRCGCHAYQGHLSARALEPALAEQRLRAASPAPP